MVARPECLAGRPRRSPVYSQTKSRTGQKTGPENPRPPRGRPGARHPVSPVGFGLPETNPGGLASWRAMGRDGDSGSGRGGRWGGQGDGSQGVSKRQEPNTTTAVGRQRLKAKTTAQGCQIAPDSPSPLSRLPSGLSRSSTSVQTALAAHPKILRGPPTCRGRATTSSTSQGRCRTTLQHVSGLCMTNGPGKPAGETESANQMSVSNPNGMPF